MADLDLDQLLNAEVTTASKTSERVEDAPGSITVITRQQIEDLNARSMRELLNVLVPGMDVVPTDFKFGDNIDQGIYSRGLPSDFSQEVLILYNGQAKFNETTFESGVAVPMLTLENVERIEVSRSPIPFYGGGAATVINVITRERTFNGAESAVDFQVTNTDDFPKSGFGGKRFSALVGKDIGSWHFGTSVQYYDDRGQQLTNASAMGGPTTFSPDTIRDGTRSAAAATLCASTLDGRFTGHLLLSHVERDPFLTGFSASPNVGPYGMDSTQFVTAFRYRVSERLELTESGMFSRWSESWNLGGTPYGGAVWNTYDNLEADYRRHATLLGEHQFLAGAKLEAEGQYDTSAYLWNGTGFVSTGPDDPRVFAKGDIRTVVSGFLEDNWHVRDNLSILGGVRADEYLGFGSATEFALNPRVAATWTVTPRLVLKALYASALRPPSLYETVGLNRFPLLGTPGLKSEQVQTFELAAIVRAAALKVQVTPHLEVARNAIEYVPVGSNFVAQNTGTTQAEGVDVDAWYYFDARNYLFANETFLHSENLPTGQQTPFLPSEYLNAGVNLNWRRFDLNLAGSLRGPRTLPADLVINRSYNHTTVYLNGNLSYSPTKGVRVYVLGENLTDQPNWVPLARDGYLVPLRPLTVHVGLVYTVD